MIRMYILTALIAVASLVYWHKSIVSPYVVEVERLIDHLVLEGDTVSAYECQLLSLPADCGDNIRQSADDGYTAEDRAVLQALGEYL